MNGQETAAGHLLERIPVVARNATVADALALLQKESFDPIDAVYVTEGGCPVGYVHVFSLLAASLDSPIEDVMEHLHLEQMAELSTDQEELASLVIRHRLSSIPVVDQRGALAGVVDARAVIGILRREHVEDIHRLAGIRHQSAQAFLALEAPALKRARDRLPWLLVGLIGSSLATVVMSRFEEALRAHIAVAFFIPAIVYLADAIGTQTEAIAVRGLSLELSPIRRLLAGELRTGLLIGAVLAVISYLLVLLFLGDSRIAAAVAVAIVGAGTVATTIGLLLPWSLARMGKDPAFGSGPLGTVIQDIMSLLIYLAIVSLLVIGRGQ